MSKQKFAVLLSGCGVFDGSEVNEVVLSLLALESNDIDYQCFAPETNQYHAINHFTKRVDPCPRNVLQESARIVRGNITALCQCNPDDFDALIVPGGFGVAKNFSNFAFEGENFSIDPEILTLLKTFRFAGKPVGYLCIAPMLLPLIYSIGVKMTIGDNKELIAIAEKMGAIHQKASAQEIVIDERNRVISTPAYMQSSNLCDLKQGIDKLVLELKRMSQPPH